MSNNSEDKLIIVCEVKENSLKNTLIFGAICEEIYKAIMLHHEINTSMVLLLPPHTLEKTTSGKVRRRYTRDKMEQENLHVLYKWEKNKYL